MGNVFQKTIKVKRPSAYYGSVVSIENTTLEDCVQKESIDSLLSDWKNNCLCYLSLSDDSDDDHGMDHNTMAAHRDDMNEFLADMYRNRGEYKLLVNITIYDTDIRRTNILITDDKNLKSYVDNLFHIDGKAFKLTYLDKKTHNLESTMFNTDPRRCYFVGDDIFHVHESRIEYM